MPQKLKVRKITSVDLVEEGSCGEAHITLFKSKEGGTPMKFEDILKSLSEEEQATVMAELAKAKDMVPEATQTELEQAKADKAAMEADLAKSKQDLAQAQQELEEVKKSAGGGESEEDILKNADLDPKVRRVLESSFAKAKAAERMLLEQQERADQSERIAKAKELTAIPEADTRVVELLKSLKGNKEAEEQLMEVLKAANTLIEKSKLLEQQGADGSTPSTTSSDEAWSAIEKAATEVIAKGAKMTREQAISHVIEHQPTLYTAYLAAQRAEL